MNAASQLEVIGFLGFGLLVLLVAIGVAWTDRAVKSSNTVTKVASTRDWVRVEAEAERDGATRARAAVKLGMLRSQYSALLITGGFIKIRYGVPPYSGIYEVDNQNIAVIVDSGVASTRLRFSKMGKTSHELTIWVPGETASWRSTLSGMGWRLAQ